MKINWSIKFIKFYNKIFYMAVDLLCKFNIEQPLTTTCVGNIK